LKEKPTKPRSHEEIDQQEAFKEEIDKYGIPRELSEELFSHAKDTVNFQAELKAKVYFFGNIAVLTFETFESAVARLVNSQTISIVAERSEKSRFVKEYIGNAEGKILK
jgi:hypothetical protein